MKYVERVYPHPSLKDRAKWRDTVWEIVGLLGLALAVVLFCSIV